MNSNNYKDLLDQIKISDDFKERTNIMMRDNLNNKKNSNKTKKLVVSFASAAIILSAGAMIFNNTNLIPGKAPVTNANNNSNTVTNSATKGITIPLTQIPEQDAGIKGRMLPLFVYQGKVYLQSNTAFESSDGITLNKDDVLALQGDFLGTTKGSIDEWSTQDDYATEFASTIGEGKVYTVKGYDSNHRLMVYYEYPDGFYCDIFDSFGGLTIDSGADYFDLLNLKDNIVSIKWESFDSWNNGKGEKADATIDTTFNDFINALYESTPIGDNIDMLTENTDYDSQKFITVKTKDNLLTSLRLFKGGYVYTPEAGFFQLDLDTFNAYWDTLPVSAPEVIDPVTDTTNDSNSVSTDITVAMNTNTLKVGAEKLTLTITNNGDEAYFYGADYSIEKLNGSTYEVIPAVKDLAFIEIAYSIEPGTSVDFDIDLKALNPSLESGKYRVVKNISGEVFNIDFEITN